MMKFTLAWLKEHLDTDRPLGELADKLTMIGLEVERIEDKAKAVCAVRHRARGRRQAASECGSSPRLHGRYRRWRSGPGGVRRAQCPHRHEKRVRAAGRLHSRQEHHARRRQDPRRRKPRHAGVGSRAANLRQPRRHHRSAGRCPGRRALRQICRARRSGDRDQSDAEPRRRHRRARHRARPCRRRHGQVQRSGNQAGQRRVSLSGEGDARFRFDAVAVPSLRATPGARRQERTVAGMAAKAADCDRPAPDQCAGRYHQLHHL